MICPPLRKGDGPNQGFSLGFPESLVHWVVNSFLTHTGLLHRKGLWYWLKGFSEPLGPRGEPGQLLRDAA